LSIWHVLVRLDGDWDERAFKELLSNPDPEKLQRVMKSMLAMKKLDIRALTEACK
jgi:hypothetical protein